MAAKTTKAPDPIAAANKNVNRAIKSIFRVGNLKKLTSAHIDKIETALTKQVTAAVNKLKNPGKTDGDFTL